MTSDTEFSVDMDVVWQALAEETMVAQESATLKNLEKELAEASLNLEEAQQD
jgi:hypothetical protein